MTLANARLMTSLLAISTGLAQAAPALAQLRPDEVLVVYDSRIPDSRAVAEFYAGSSKVPGGSGNEPGFRKGVRVLNLQTTGAPITTSNWCTYPEFVTSIRNPIRTHLTSQGLTRSVRCIVMTKGLPHRMDDSDNTAVGDNPAAFVDEFNAQDVTCASIDSQLTLVWQNLNTGESGNGADSKDDGVIINPYWKSALPIGSFSNSNNTVAKTLTATGFGPVYSGTGAGTFALTPGDIYLVTRLDASTVADVQSMVIRGANILYNVNTDQVLLDESGSNGIADTSGNGEYDNQASLTGLRSGDDYERTRDYLTLTDKRFAAANIRYDAIGNAANFFIGPRLSPTGGILVTAPVALIATYGSNHAGTFPTYSGGSTAAVFASSFNYANGAIFNTIESYNGRDFGGVGVHSFIPQEQVSHFIAAGGTLGIGHVWEPLADTIPDNEFLVTNFLSGNLSWAEAAWTSIPCLSWMHVVIGDPLARPARTSEDVDNSGRIGAGDAYAWQATPTDIDRSGTADNADRLVLQKTLRFYERSDLINRRP